MRKNKSFRPSDPAALEPRVVLSAGASALTLYKADLPGNVQAVLSPLTGQTYNAFYNSGYSSSFSLSQGGPAQFNIIQGSLVTAINNTAPQLADLLAPLKKSANITATVQTEIANLSTETNNILNQLATTMTTVGGVTKVDSASASLAEHAIVSMENTASLAIGNQVYLFLHGAGISTKPGKAFLSSRVAAYNSALAAPFAQLTTGLQTAYASYVTSLDTATFESAVFSQLGTLTASVTRTFAANGIRAAAAGAAATQVTGLDSGSVYQVITDLTSSLGTTYPAGFVNAVIGDVDSVLQTDLAATGGA